MLLAFESLVAFQGWKLQQQTSHWEPGGERHEFGLRGTFHGAIAVVSCCLLPADRWYQAHAEG